MVSFAQTPVTVSNNQFSSLQFTQELARTKSCQQGDSFFVADLGKISLLVNQWGANLPRVRPFYALNCNSDELLLRVMSSFPQIGFHCSTRQHLDVALDFVGSSRVFYSNACWTRNALNNAQSNNVEILGFDSESDLARMAKAEIKNKLILNICMNNSEEQLGCEVSKAPELLQLATDFGLDCVGVGFNVCSQRPALYDSMIECAAQLFAFGNSIGLRMSVLNLGGGFPSLISTQIPSFEQISEQLNISLDYYFPPTSNVEIIATPGRFFASSIFSLATRIVNKAEIDASQITNDDFDAGQRGFVYTINEGYYGPFGCRMMPNCEPKCLPLFADSNTESDQLFYGSVNGPLNDEFDVVQKQFQLRQMTIGEWLIWPNMGAYSMNNCDSLDADDICTVPEIYYYSKENDWKYASDSTSDFVDVLSSMPDSVLESDGEESINSIDSAIEMDEDPFWLFNLAII
jgi:ornithine decarboxylase